MIRLKTLNKQNQLFKGTVKYNSSVFPKFLLSNLLLFLILYHYCPIPTELIDQIQLLVLPIIFTNLVILILTGETLIKENLIVIKNLGVQIEKKKKNGKKTVQFIQLPKVKDIVIQEVSSL